MALGRPIEPVPQDIADELVAWIAEGKTLREFCRQPGMPVYSTIYDWEEKDKDFATRIAHARLIGEDVIAQECLAIADNTQTGKTVTEKPYVFEGAAVKNADGTPVMIIETKTGDMLEHRKMQIDTRLKLLAKWNPRKYGDSLKHTGADGESAIQFVITRAGRDASKEKSDG